MTIRETIFCWFLTLLTGSVLCSLFSGGEPLLIIIFIVVAGISSLPFLIIYSLLTRIIFNFFILQLLHAVLAFVTLIAIMALQTDSEDYFFAGVVLVYFVVGVIIQVLTYYRKLFVED